MKPFSLEFIRMEYSWNFFFVLEKYSHCARSVFCSAYTFACIDTMHQWKCVRTAHSSVLFKCFCFNSYYFVECSLHAHMLQSDFRSLKYSKFDEKMWANAWYFYVIIYRSSVSPLLSSILPHFSILIAEHLATESKSNWINCISYEWYRRKWTILIFCVRSSAEREQEIFINFGFNSATPDIICGRLFIFDKRQPTNFDGNFKKYCKEF